MAKPPAKVSKPKSKRKYRWRRQAVGIARARRRIKRSVPSGARFIIGLFAIMGMVAGYILWRSPSLLPVEPVPVKFFQISTGAPGGTYFTVGRTLAAAISRPPGAEPCGDGGPCGVTGLIAIAKAAPGSVANIRAIAGGRIDSALAQADIAAWAYSGRRMFKRTGRVAQLRAIASLYPEAVHLVAAKQANITSVSDLRKLRVSVGKLGSGTRTDALLILRSFNIRPGQFKLVSVDAPQAADMMLQGKLDAFFIVAGTPVATISDLIENDVANLVPIAGKRIKTLLKRNSFFLPHTIAAGTYPGQGEVKTVSVRALWITSSKTSYRLIKQITKVLWNKPNRSLLDQGHAKTKLMTMKSALNGIPIPLHEGAKAYYREAGILPGG